MHGSGGQTRAFINIQDTVRCVELAVANPPQRGERVRIFNQMTETFRLIDLARMISDMTGAQIAHVPNPRKEADANDLVVENRACWTRPQTGYTQRRTAARDHRNRKEICGELRQGKDPLRIALVAARASRQRV